MNGGLPSVVRAIILASVPVCALLAGCGGRDNDSSAIDFDVDKLSQRGIEVAIDGSCASDAVDPAPCGATADEVIGIQEATASLGQGAPDVLQGELVQIRLSDTPHFHWGRAGEFRAWALEFDPGDDNLSHFEIADCNGQAHRLSPGGVTYLLVFVDATDGGCLAISAAYGEEGGDS